MNGWDDYVPRKILIRATNWVGDAVMSLPAIRAVRSRFPEAEIAVLAKPWVADLYARETAIDRVIPYDAPAGWKGWTVKWQAARKLAGERFDMAVLLQNAFEAAAVVWLAGIPRTVGYARDGRGLLLTHPVAVPERGAIPEHERFYYLELLSRAGLFSERRACADIRLEGSSEAASAGREHLARAGMSGAVIGVSPGAAYGTAKRWLPERFAAAALEIAHQREAGIALFGSKTEAELCRGVAEIIEQSGGHVRSFAGQTSLREFLEMAAACSLFLTNDSGAMHVASAMGVPSVTVFGATNDAVTGPTGPFARVIRHAVDCSPCLLRECPIDHRCMTRVSSAEVVQTGMALLDERAGAVLPPVKGA